MVVLNHKRGDVVLARSRINRGRARRDELRKEAESRASDRASMSLAAKIASLDSRLGVGVGAVRERARLEKEVELARDGKSRGRPSKSKTSKKSTRSTRRKEKAGRHRHRREVDQEWEGWGDAPQGLRMICPLRKKKETK